MTTEACCLAPISRSGTESLVRNPGFSSIACELIDPQVEPDWDSVVAQHPESLIFHRSAWARALSNTYGHHATYLRFTDGRELVALVPLMEISSFVTGKRGVGLPFTDVCCPLFFKETCWEGILTGISRVAQVRDWKSVELRDARFPMEASDTGSQMLVHTLDLSLPIADVFARFSSSVRSAIRRAIRNGVTVRFGTDGEGLREYYHLHEITRRRHGLPPQPYSFFENIRVELLANGLGFIALAYHNSRTIAGAVFLRGGNTASFKFGASNTQGRRYSANNLVMWESIKRLAELGVNSLHLGRTEVANASLRRFKLGWGTEERAAVYLRFDPHSGEMLPRSDLTCGLHTHFFKRMPLAVNRVMGELLYPHLD